MRSEPSVPGTTAKSIPFRNHGKMVVARAPRRPRVWDWGLAASRAPAPRVSLWPRITESFLRTPALPTLGFFEPGRGFRMRNPCFPKFVTVKKIKILTEESPEPAERFSSKNWQRLLYFLARRSSLLCAKASDLTAA